MYPNFPFLKKGRRFPPRHESEVPALAACVGYRGKTHVLDAGFSHFDPELPSAGQFYCRAQSRF
jgi:hypothetical protein